MVGAEASVWCAVRPMNAHPSVADIHCMRYNDKEVRNRALMMTANGSRRRFDVLGVGELNVDIVLTGLRGMPVPGREILATGCSVVMGSSTAICVAGLSRLGFSTSFVGSVGADAFGEKVLACLSDVGVDTAQVHVLPEVETGATICLATGSDRALVTHLGGSISHLTADAVTDTLLSEVRHVHVGSFFLQHALRPGLADLFRRAHACGATTSLDAGWDDTETWDGGLTDILPHVDVFLPNESEATAITGLSDPEAAAEALSRHGAVCVKLGSEGALFRKGNLRLRRSAIPGVVPVDTTGAGDSFNAGFLYAMLMGMDWERCLAFGNACGAVSVTRVGGASACATLAEAEAVVAAGRGDSIRMMSDRSVER